MKKFPANPCLPKIGNVAAVNAVRRVFMKSTAVKKQNMMRGRSNKMRLMILINGL